MPGPLGPDPETCPNCGHGVGNSAVICLECGLILVKAEDIVPGLTRQQVRRMKFYRAALGAECAPTRQGTDPRSWSEILDALESAEPDSGGA